MNDLTPPQPIVENLPPAAQNRFNEALLEEGRGLLEEGSLDAAFERFQAAASTDPGHARARSYLGLTLALTQRKFDQAVELCSSAAKQEFFNPEVYHNLARVYLEFGFKTEGRRYLLRGQMIDPANEEIRRALADLGNRNEPVLAFLPRRHILNRWLGSARFVLSKRSGHHLAA